MLKHAQYQYQLAATCSQERDIWINKLQETASQRRQCWLDAICHNPVAQPYDDVSISSVTIQPEHIPSSTARPNTDAIQASSARAPPRANLSSSSLNSLSGRGLFNFNQTASALLGKGSKQTLDLIDLRLAEVFSDVLLTARSKGDEENTLFIGDRSHMRARSDPKHSNVQPPSQVSRRATTRDIQRQKSMILEHSVPQLHKASASQTIRLHGRRPSADAALSEPSFHERSDSAPVLLQRSKTNPSKPRSTCESKTMQVWTGNLRQRTSSWMGSQLSARHLLDQQVTVARNDSSSSSGSSRDMIQTPSPMSSTPPSPLIQPIEGTSFPDNVLPSRKSSFSSSTTAFGSPEQDLQALRASEYLYDSAGSQSKAGWMSSFRKRSAPPTLTRHGRSRSHSNSSLLGLFTPALSPTVASPLDEEASAPNSSPPSSASAVSVSEVQLADIALSSTASPVTLSPPPAKSPLRRSKSKRLSSLFPLTRMQSTTNASQTSLTSPS